MSRPFLPPSLAVLSTAGPAAERLAAEQRRQDAAFDAGHARGVEEGFARGLEEGRTAGIAAGRAAAEADLAARHRDGASAAAAALAALFEAREHDRQALDAEMRAVLAAALRTLMPALAARHGVAEAIAVAAEALREREPDAVALRASPGTIALMRDEGFPAPADAERLRLVPDPSLQAGTIEATWEGGGLRRDPRLLVARILAVLGAPAGTDIRQKEQRP